jgi:hypothetical protein
LIGRGPVVLRPASGARGSGPELIEEQYRPALGP